MNLTLQDIVPIPLRDRFDERHSELWHQQVVLAQGEFIKVKAPSGTGKTTLIHILYHLRKDYEGTVAADGKDMRSFSEDELADLRQRKLAIVFQDLRLFPNLTARENIELKRVLQHPYHDAEMIDVMAAAVGVTHILDQRSELCSYGEQQRIAIIRALIQPFDWLIMDEPFSHLDIENTEKAAAMIDAECRKRNAGLLITDLDEDNHFSYNRKFAL